MDVFVTLFTAIGGALVAGIFSVIVKKMDAATQEQRDAQKKQMNVWPGSRRIQKNWQSMTVLFFLWLKLLNS